MYLTKKNLALLTIFSAVLSTTMLRGMDSGITDPITNDYDYAAYDYDYDYDYETHIPTESISITTPLTASNPPFNPIVLTGTSSLSSALVNILLDGTVVASTTTDEYGNWQISYTLIIENGTHTFLVQLTAEDNVTIVASATVDVNVQNSVNIIDPIYADYGTVSGSPLVVSGTASVANAIVRLTYDNIPAPAAITDAYGNWSATYNLIDGNHTIIAQLSTPDRHGFLAMDQVTCIVQNPPSITIVSPVQGNTISYEPLILSGTASLPLAPVQISLDGTLVATTNTDGNGNWQASYTPTIPNGMHTFLVELVDSDYGDYDYNDYPPLASTTVDINIAVPIVFPTGKNQVSVIAGLIPTSGSGSGPAYTYTISGSIATINFIPAFDSIPSVNATGLRSSGSSTVSVASISPTAASIAFSTGTQYINFTAAIFS